LFEIWLQRQINFLKAIKGLGNFKRLQFNKSVIENLIFF